MCPEGSWVLQAASDFARTKTIAEQRRFLPVYDCREELLQVIRENQVVVVVGETGSGKTTQVCTAHTMLIWLWGTGTSTLLRLLGRQAVGRPSQVLHVPNQIRWLGRVAC